MNTDKMNTDKQRQNIELPTFERPGQLYRVFSMTLESFIPTACNSNASYLYSLDTGYCQRLVVESSALHWKDTVCIRRSLINHHYLDFKNQLINALFSLPKIT